MGFDSYQNSIKDRSCNVFNNHPEASNKYMRSYDTNESS